VPKTDFTAHLPIFKAKSRAICPYCHQFITQGSVIVRLDEPATPLSLDGRFCWRTEMPYYYDGRTISMHPRDYAHWHCYKEVLIEFGGYCWYCESEIELTIDHIKPTSLGGADTPGNITVACRSCNSSKGTKPYDEFVRTLSDEHQKRIYNN
jgi:hypothetical protein